MNDYKNFCEYVIRPIPSGKTRFARALLVSLYTVFTAAYVIVFQMLLGLWTLLVLLPFLLFAIYRLTWRLVDIEYDVALEAGELTVAYIYGKSSRRVKCRVYVPEMTFAAKADSAVIERTSTNVDSIKYYTENGIGVNTYIFVYSDSKRGSKHAVIIDTTDELLRIMRLCNPSLFAGIPRTHR